jgi:hypothetical protein
VVSKLMSAVSRAKVVSAVSFAVLVTALLGSSVAAAATQVGIKFGGPGSDGFPGTMLQTQTEEGVNDYKVPSAGVITSWSSYKGSQPQQLKLKVGRLVASSDYTVVGESALETLTVAGTNLFPTRIAVAAGDVIGLYSATSNVGTVEENAGFDFEMFRQLNADLAPGGPYSLEGPFLFDAINVAAYLEPDADSDGFGDESQDKCPGSAGTVDGCVPASPAPAPTQTVTPPTINTDPIRPVAKSCPKGKKKVRVKGVSKCVKAKKHKGKAKAKGKGHKK